MGLRFFIDRGGTFTDCVVEIPSSPIPEIKTLKLLSHDPEHYDDAPREGIRRLLEIVNKRNYPQDQPLDASSIDSIRMATTVATNALLERKGERFALLVTAGFRDLLRIGNQSRPNIFDLSINAPNVLYDEVVEIKERVTLVDTSPEQGDLHCETSLKHGKIVRGITGEFLQILQEVETEEVAKQLRLLLNKGIRCVAVVFLHAYNYPHHEQKVGDLALSMGFDYVALSSQGLPMVKVVPRGMKTCVDAYLTPKNYVQSFLQGFDRSIENVSVEFMRSDGGLSSAHSFSGYNSILSGPAAGVVGFSRTAYHVFDKMPLLGFDMGGTSTDVCRYDGHLDSVYESVIAGISMQVPQLDIQTVASGGGSRLFFRNGAFCVGPESAGAHPGPACYRKGGPLTVTDANLLLGRIMPDYFPKIFGPNEDQPLDYEVVREKFAELLIDVNLFLSSINRPFMSIYEIASGFLQVANEAMCRPIRALTQSRGYDTKSHVLCCFGGAGGQHACAIAQALGIDTIFIHRHTSVLSAYGLGLASVTTDVQEACSEILREPLPCSIQERIKKLSDTCKERLKRNGFSNERIRLEVYLNLRYEGTDSAMMTQIPIDTPALAFLKDAFEENYKREFGFTLTGRNIVIDDIRIRGIGLSDIVEDEDEPFHEYAFCKLGNSVWPESDHDVFYEKIGHLRTPFYRLCDLPIHSFIDGPAMIVDTNTTIMVEPNTRAFITPRHSVVLKIRNVQAKIAHMTNLDPVYLSIFSHRFMSIAEQMGKTLQRTSISTNIKERLDFSCALFGPDGSLVANAPHIPVHLGSMQEAVRFQLSYYKDDIREGDVLVSNHPKAGGSHLPDITVITPVFSNGKIVFFVASRGHHSDIGGIAPGSMPPHSQFLYEEGAAIKSMKLVENGIFQEDKIRAALMTEPAKYPGCSGSRNIHDNLSDLKAQIAANNRGILLVSELINEYGLDMVHAYMNYIRTHAELAVRELLKEVSKRFSNQKLFATDFMDDGTPICLTVTIDQENGDAIFDFTGTGPQALGNLNAPPSVTYSAIIYCLRCMVVSDIPLNQGCLVPIRTILPESSILNPDDSAAVVGGNVLTSQRIVDTILKAFGACADSQGCMNNLTFGMPPQDDRAGFGYYETIAGGSGAGPSWAGQDGVHTHMTNTRITDPEILERRYPVILHEFSIRKGSGGLGEFPGGNGVIRELEFLAKMRVSILSERRVFRPKGMAGGGDALCGLNLLIDGSKIVNLTGKNSFWVYPGNRVRICSPGGGGYGQRKQSETMPLKYDKQLLDYIKDENKAISIYFITTAVFFLFWATWYNCPQAASISTPKD